MSMSIANLLCPQMAAVGAKRPASCMCTDSFVSNKRPMLSAANRLHDSNPHIASNIVVYPGLPVGLAPPPGLPVPVHLQASAPNQFTLDEGIVSYQAPIGFGLGLGIIIPLGTVSKSLGLYGESRRLPKGPVARWIYPYAATLPPIMLPSPTQSEPFPHPVETTQASTPDALVRSLVQSFTNWQVPSQPTHRTNPSMYLPLPSPQRAFSLLEPAWITPEEERLFDLGKDEVEVAHIGARLYLERAVERTSFISQGGIHVRNALANFRTRFGEIFAITEGSN